MKLSGWHAETVLLFGEDYTDYGTLNWLARFESRDSRDEAIPFYVRKMLVSFHNNSTNNAEFLRRPSTTISSFVFAC